MHTVASTLAPPGPTSTLMAKRACLVVLRPILVARKHSQRLWLEDRDLVGLAGKGADRVQGLEPGPRHKRDLVPVATAQNVGTQEAGDRPHRGEQFSE